MYIMSYKNTEAIDEGYLSGQVFPSAQYNVKDEDLIVVVANNEKDNSIEGYVIKKEWNIPNWLVKRTFLSSRQKGNVNPSSYNGFGGKPVARFKISNKQFGMYQGGKVGVKDGSQKFIAKWVKELI